MQEESGFEYLWEAAGKYGNFYAVDEFESFVDNVTEGQLKELRTAYEAIGSRDDSFRISRWMDDCFERRWTMPKRGSDFSMRVHQMFVLFKYFLERGIAPFDSEKVQYIPIYKKPNWQNLPAELEYMIEPAEAYGHYQFESAILDFLDHAHANDMEVLARTAERIRLNGHSTAIDLWLKRPDLGMTEWALVYWLMMMIFHAGLDFESPA